MSSASGASDLIAAGVLLFGGSPDSISRRAVVDTNGQFTDAVPTDADGWYNVIYGIDFGEDVPADVFEFTTNHPQLANNRRILGAATIKTGIPVLIAWTPSTPFRYTVINKGGGDGAVWNIGLSFLQFKKQDDFDAFMAWLRSRYDHRASQEVVRKAAERLGVSA